MVLTQLHVPALATYDYLLTLHREVRCIWQQKCSKGTILFVANRYALLSFAVVLVTLDLTSNVRVRVLSVIDDPQYPTKQLTALEVRLHLSRNPVALSLLQSCAVLERFYEVFTLTLSFCTSGACPLRR